MNRQYKEEANAKRLVFVQIEHKDGVKNAEAIVQLPGIDGIMIGPYDLSGSYGKPGQIEDDEVAAAIDHVLNICKKYQKPIGIFAKEAMIAKKYREKGFQLIAVGIDIHTLWSAAQTVMISLKK